MGCNNYDCQGYQSSSWPDRLLSVDRGRAVRELVRGRHVASQLWSLLGKRKSPSADGAPAEDLVVQILKSISATISVLNSSSESSDSDEVSQPLVSDDSDTCKSTSAPRRAASYKKRKTDNTYTKVTTDLTDDGYAWRKYGQKEILHTEFPRNYFRCTHKYDKPGCLATKQVQQMSKDPPTFRTTYQNHHTCKNILKPPQFVFEPTPTNDSSTMMCFQTNTSTTGQQDCRNYNNTLFSSSCFASTSTVTDEIIKEEIIKEEIIKEEIKSDDYNDRSQQQQQQQPSDYNYMAVSLPEMVDQLGSSDQNNGTSCDTSSHGFEFDDVCNFDFGVDGAYYHYP